MNFIGASPGFIGEPMRFIGTPPGFIGVPPNFIGASVSFIGAPMIFLAVCIRLQAGRASATGVDSFEDFLARRCFRRL